MQRRLNDYPTHLRDLAHSRWVAIEPRSFSWQHLRSGSECRTYSEAEKKSLQQKL